jgi:hypothetical protein
MTEHNSRWDRNPRREDGKVAVALLNERDIEIFKLLARYRYLPADFIHALVGGSYQGLIRRLDLLTRKPNQYILRPAAQREHAEANYRKLIYELDDKGSKLLQDRWPTIRASDKFPAATREMSNPFRLVYGNAKDDSLEPDWEPFVLAKQTDEETSFIFCPGFEADCDTESLESGRYAHATIQNKFRGYLAIIERGIYRSHYGANTFMVPFVTTNETRMRNMMDLLGRMIGNGPHEKSIAKRFLFKHMPAFTSFKQSAPATGHMLTEPWARVGYPDFHFDK